ncbi:hypothetical protein LCGC14_1199060 [marine sediment metagenome]|uniref:ABC transporter ATP-binding protein n=1 Tax=marine sediment metagenome TaxID=412755 RepID=A0A0F9PM91_9ZZZZ
MINRIRIDLLRAVAGADWAAATGHRSSDLTHLLTGEVDRVNIAATSLLNIVQSVIVVGVYFAASLLVSPLMSLVAAGLGLVMSALMRPVRREAARMGNSITRHRQEQFRTLIDFLGGIKVVKSLNVEQRSIARLSGTLDLLRRDSFAFLRLSTLGTLMFQVSNAIGLAVFVYVALDWIGMPLPQLVVLLFILMRIAPRALMIERLYQQLLQNLPAFDIMRDSREHFTRHAEHAGPGGAPVPSLVRDLRCSGIGFRHPDAEAAALEDVSFTMPAGTVTALIGPSGSGKTTLSNILMGLVEPEYGHLIVDGEVLRSDQLRAWRDQVAFVPQDTFLMHDTVAENLRLAVPDASDTALWTALELAQAKSFVEALPAGLDTVVGDRGAALSGGEGQRIALAFALLRQPRLLVLDEATSALDAENQALIARAISRLKQSITIVTIAHR